jgi:hypothetical protein
VALTGCDVPSLNRSLSRIMTVGVIMAGMAGNVLLCDRGRLLTSSLKLGSYPTRFWVTELNWRGKGRRGITWMGKPDQCVKRGRMNP